MSSEETGGALQSIECHIADLITAINPDGTIFHQSPASERILGYHPEEMLGSNVFDYLHPGDLERGRTNLEEALSKPGFGPPVEFRWRHKDGSWRWLESVGNNLVDDPTVEGIIAVSRDVTGRKSVENEARYRALVENLPMAILVENEARRILSVNQNFCEMFEIDAPPEVMIGADCSDSAEREKHRFVDPEHFISRIDEILKKQEPVICEELQLVDGRTLERDYVPVFVGSEYRGHMWTYRDITERRTLEKEIEHLAYHDPLTNLPNRSRFMDRIEEALARSRSNGGTPAVLFVDLDDFKEVNDKLGHEAGDALLVQVSEKLVPALRAGDVVCRLGGGEFAVLLEERDPRAAAQVAESLLRDLQSPMSSANCETARRLPR